MTITVIVPAYNEEKLIGQCLQSLVNQQTSTKFDVILVDNNSTDQTVKIAKNFNVKIVNEPKKGVIFAKQRGYLSAKSDIIAYLDADSVASPDWINQIISEFNDLNVVAVTGPYFINDGPKFQKPLALISHQIIRIIYWITGNSIYLSGGNCAYRKSALDIISGFDTNNDVGEDEIGVMSKIKKYGKVIYNYHQQILTSGRRANDGFFSFLNQVLLGYWLNYTIHNLTGKKLSLNYKDYR